MTKPRRVLIVDDNDALAENFQEILSEAGHQVTRASSCAEALLSPDFEVAIVDLRLPDGDGTELAGKLRTKCPDGEVVILTGFGTVESAAVAVRAGAFAYLLKPVSPPLLMLTVEQALRQVRLKQEKRELAARTLMSEKLATVGTLTAGLSHEIRNPLNAAGLQLQVLDRRVRKLPADHQGPLLEPLELVRDEIRRLDQILQDFLQFARPRELNAKAVDLKTIVDRCFDLLAGDAERRHVNLERDMPAVPPVRGDEDRLKQVVMNLALNAIDAAPPGGHVRAHLEREGPMVTLSIEDSGAGVPLALRERIFEPFFTTKAQGTGLGLPMVHSIVGQHGGTVRVGDAPEGGARFEVRLPAA